MALKSLSTCDQESYVRLLQERPQIQKKKKKEEEFCTLVQFD
jgi:hypothetical protein